MLDTIVSAIGTDTFWVAVGAIGAVVALVLTYMQLRAFKDNRRSRLPSQT